jgi:hypothetical protein
MEATEGWRPTMMGQRREAEKRQLEMVGDHDESGYETQLE